MSQENVEIVRRGMDPFNQHFENPEVDLSSFAPDLTVDNLAATFDGKVYRGHDGLREWLSLHRGMWKRQQTEPQEFIPVGDDQVVVPIRIVSVGRDDVETAAHAVLVMTVRDRKIAHIKGYQSKAEALEAVGLSENVIVVREIYAAWAEDRSAAPFIDRELEYVNPPEAVEPGTRRGRHYLRKVREIFPDVRFEPERYIDAGDDVVVIAKIVGRGSSSGVEAERRQGYIWTISEGKAVRFRWFNDPADALAAVGLLEQDARGGP